MNDVSNKIYDFISKYRQKHPKKLNSDVCFNNIYHIVCEDMDGNVTDEKFGVNVITNKGLEVLGLHTFNSSNFMRIWLGTDTGSISPSSDTMTKVFDSRCPANGVNEQLQLGSTYPVNVYDSVSDVVRSYIGFAYAIFDYDYENIENDVDIYEIGLNSSTSRTSVDPSNDRLVTHSKIYDNTGTQTYFTKHIHEKVTVTMYFGIEMDMATSINTLWTNGNYVVINPIFYIINAFNRRYIFNSGAAIDAGVFIMLGNVAGAVNYSSSDVKIAYAPFSYDEANGIKTTYDTSLGNVKTEILFNVKRGEGAPILYENNYVSKLCMYDKDSNTRKSKNNYIFAHIGYDAGICLPNPESFGTYLLSNFFDNTFDETLFTLMPYNRDVGKPYEYWNALQLNQLNVTSMKLYDHNTHAWVTETYTQDPTFILDGPLFHTKEENTNSTGCVLYPVMLNDIATEAYVFANANAGTHDILSFDTDSAVVYATDTYWDPSTWEQVTYLNVQSALRRKKFYIAVNNFSYLHPHYDVTTLRLTNLTEKSIPRNGLYVIPPTDSGNKYSYDIISNPSCNCIVGINKIIYPDDENDVVTYTIKNYGGYDCNGNIEVAPSSIRTTTLGMFKMTADGTRLIMAHLSHINTTGNCGSFHGGCYRIYTISNDKTVEPTYLDIELGYTTVTKYTPTRQTFTDQGYLACCHNEDEEIRILNVYNPYVLTTEEPDDWSTNYTDYYTYDSSTNTYSACVSDTWVADTVYKFNVVNLTGTWVHALNRTTNCVYRNMDDTSSLNFDIYDMSTNTVIDSFTISGNYTMNGICGWKNNIYVRVYNQDTLIYEMFHYSVTTNELTQISEPPTISETNNAMNFSSYGIHDNSLTSNDECMVFPMETNSSSLNEYVQPFRLVFDNNPLVFRDISSEMGLTTYPLYTRGRLLSKPDNSFVALEVSNYYYNGSQRSMHYYKGKWGDINSNKQVWLMDIGLIYDTNEIPPFYSYNTSYHTRNTSQGNFRLGVYHTIYKNYDIWYDSTTDTLRFIPDARARIHKIEATTKTIQTINNPKRILPNDKFIFTIDRN